MAKLKQKLYGILLIALGIITILPERDATAAVLIVPLGIYILLTREQVMDF